MGNTESYDGGASPTVAGAFSGLFSVASGEGGGLGTGVTGAVRLFQKDVV